MKAIFITIFFLLAISVYSQDLVEKKIDDNVSLNLPENTITKDTLGRHLMISQLLNGLIIITKAELNTAIVIPNNKKLKSSYSAFQRGVLKGLKGTSISEEILTIHDIKVSLMKCTATVNNEFKHVDSYGLFLENHYYSITFQEAEPLDENFAEQKEKIISSLRFKTGLTNENQFSHY